MTTPRDFLLFAALPRWASDLDPLIAAAGLAEPWIDLRREAVEPDLSLASRAVASGLEGLTLVFNGLDAHAVAIVSLLPKGGRAVLSGCRGAVPRHLAAICRERGVLVGAEVFGLEHARRAAREGADFLVFSAVESAGAVSERTGLVLIQEFDDAPDIPIPRILRADVGPLGAAAAFAAGWAGAVVETPLLLASDAGIPSAVRTAISDAGPADTVLVGGRIGSPHRFLPRGATAELREIADVESKLLASPLGFEERARAFQDAVLLVRQRSNREGSGLLPVGQGLGFAQAYQLEGLSVSDILGRYLEAIPRWVEAVRESYPFAAGSRLSQIHGTRFPVVQGPMALVTSVPRLAAEVARAGGLPFVASTGLSADATRELLAETTRALDAAPFGVGVVGFPEMHRETAGATGAAPPKRRGEEVFDAVAEVCPRFAIIAGGSPSLARKFQDRGIAVYLHAPTLTHIRDLVDAGVEGMVLEGHEAGGHVGSLGSLILWEQASNEIVSRPPETTAALRVLFAGGLGGATGALVAAVIAAPLACRGIAVGLQIGTSYLMTEQAWRSGAVPPRYVEALRSGRDTALTGQGVNMPSRWLATPEVEKMLDGELELEAEGVPFRERKQRGEAVGLARSLASLAGRPPTMMPESAGPEAYSCGQVIAAVSRLRSIVGLHEELCLGGAMLARLMDVAVCGREETDPTAADIAIVGIGCLFPGATNPAAFWENLLAGRSEIREVPASRWDTSLYFDPAGRDRDKSSSKLGSFLDGFEKRPMQFRIPPCSAEFIDETQFMGLEIAEQALRDAGCLDREFPRHRTAVFMGGGEGGELRANYHLRASWARFAASLTSSRAWGELPNTLRDTILDGAETAFKSGIPEFSEDTAPGIFGSLLAGRICSVFDLEAVGLVLDAACATSLAAVDAAVTGLRQKRFDLALAGAVDVKVDPAAYILFSGVGALSNSGSRPFDERADGFVLGEGAGLVVLKRLEDAERDGDRIYAVIKAVAGGSDGKGKGITAPSVEGQLRTLESAWAGLGFGPDTLDLIEAHGTSTRIGDITELRSLDALVSPRTERRQAIALGSVKSNIGHLKTAAGIAGLIKVALALHHRVLPPTIGCEQPRLDYDWERSPFYLSTRPAPWPDRGRPRRAAVDAFGFGGINFHAVLEEAPRPAVAAPRGSGLEPRADAIGLAAETLVFRAEGRAALREMLVAARGNLAAATATNGELGPVRHVAGRLRDDSAGRPIGSSAVSIVARDTPAARELLGLAIEAIDDGRSQLVSARGVYFFERGLAKDEKVAFLFPGQGSQYPGMGGDLSARLPFARRAFERIDQVGSYYTGTSMLDLLISAGDGEAEQARRRELLKRPDYNHQAILALGTTLVEALGRTGLRPDMVAGHSLGEYLALCAAGVMDGPAAIALTASRGRAMVDGASGAGAMAVVGLPAEKVEPILRRINGLVEVANKNCPSQTVISGETQAVEDAIARLEASGVACDKLGVSSGFHSRLFEPLVAPFRNALEMAAFQQPLVPVQSNTLGRFHDFSGDFAPALRDILAQHLVRPVEFAANVESLYAAGARLFVEVGPGSTLTSFVDDILADRPHLAIPSNLSRRPGTLQLQHVIALAAALGRAVEPEALAEASVLRRPLARSRKRSRAHEPSGPAASGLLAKLADQDPTEVARYLEERRTFLEDLVRLDFLSRDRGTSRPAADKAPPKKTLAGTAADAVATRDDLAERIVSIVARRSGYPPDVLDLDLDIEAELGLDSIKQVAILREVGEVFGVAFRGDLQRERYDLTTLRQLVGRVRELSAEAGTSPTQTSIPQISSEEAAHVPIDQQRTPTSTRCFRWVFEATEKRLELVQQPADGRVTLAPTDLRARVAIVGSANGPASVLAGALTREGAHITQFASSAPEATELHSGGTDADDGSFSAVVDLSAWDRAEAVPDGVESWWKEAATRTRRMHGLARRLARSAERSRACWVVASALGGRLGNGQPSERQRDDSWSQSWTGIGLGLGRTLRQELSPRLDFLAVDFEPSAAAEEVGETIAQELRALSALASTREAGAAATHVEVGYQGGRRAVLGWRIEREPVGPGRKRTVESGLPDSSGGDGHVLGPDSLVLAIGGARGITAAICHALARTYHPRLVIVGRTPVKEAGESDPPAALDLEAARQDLLDAARRQGLPIVPAQIERQALERVFAVERRRNLALMAREAASVRYVACDVARAGEVAALVHDLVGPGGRIDLVVQGGGSLVEKSAADFESGQIVDGMRDKALGTARVLAALEGVDVGGFVNISSISGRWGNRGAAAYATGHELAALLVCAAREQRAGRWYNLYYGPWLDLGFTKLGETMGRLRESGLDFVTENAGTHFFLDGLARKPVDAAFCGALPGSLADGQNVGLDRRGLGLIDEAVHTDPDSVEARRVFDPRREAFVGDHFVQQKVPILAGAIGLEMLAQTGSLLAEPDAELTEVEDLQFPLALKFPRLEPRNLVARAMRIRERPGWVEAVLVSAARLRSTSSAPKEMVHIRCRLRFGHRDAPPKPSLVVAGQGLWAEPVEAASLWATRNLAPRIGLYRNVRSILSATSEGVVAEIAAEPVPECGPRACLGNPLVLDGLVFVCDFSGVHLQRHPRFFFASLDRLILYGSGPAGNSRLLRSQMRLVDEGGITADGEALDTNGLVRERFFGRRSAAAAEDYPTSEPIWDALRENPGLTAFRRQLGMTVLRAAHLSVDLVDEAVRASGEAFLAEHLAPAEREVFSRLTHPLRRAQWLAGRLAAKSAVADLVGRDAPPRTAIEISSDQRGAPRVVIHGERQVGPLWISIAHSRNVAIAIASDRPIGVDVEAEGADPLSIAAEFASDVECAVVSRALGKGLAESRGVAALHLWAAKEAGRKAIGPETCTMCELVLEAASERDGLLVGLWRHPDGSQLQSVGCLRQGFVYAAAAPVTTGVISMGTIDDGRLHAG